MPCLPKAAIKEQAKKYGLQRDGDLNETQFMGNGLGREVESTGFETSSGAREAAEADALTQKSRSGSDLGLLRELRDQIKTDGDRQRRDHDAWLERRRAEEAAWAERMRVQDESFAQRTAAMNKKLDEDLERTRLMAARTSEIVQEQLAIGLDAVKQAREAAKAAHKPEKPGMSGPEAAVDIAKHFITKGAGLIEKIIETDPRAREKLREVTSHLLGPDAEAAPASPASAGGAPASAQPPVKPLPENLTIRDLYTVYGSPDEATQKEKAIELGIDPRVLPELGATVRSVAEDAVKAAAAKMNLTLEAFPVSELIKLAKDPANAADPPTASAS